MTSRGNIDDKLDCKYINEIFIYIELIWSTRFLNFILGAFDLYDIDGDGSITRSEMYKIVKAIYAMAGKYI